MRLENLFCNVDSNGRKLHLGSSGLPVNTFAYITSWYFDTVGPRGSTFILPIFHFTRWLYIGGRRSFHSPRNLGIYTGEERSAAIRLQDGSDLGG